MPKIYVHLLIGRAPDDMQGSIILESPPSHNLCEYTVWHSYEHSSMLRLGARSKKKLGPLWTFPPMQKAVSDHHGQPIENNQNAMMAAMKHMTPHQWGGKAIRRALLRRVHYVFPSRRVRCLYARTWGHADTQLVPLLGQDYGSEPTYVVAHAFG